MSDPVAPGSDDATTTLTRDALREATLRSIRWVTIARVCAEAIAFLSMLALARLIAPAAFGQAAMAVVVAAVATTVIGESFGSVLVQREELTRRVLEGAAFLSIAVGAVLSLAMFFAAPLLGPVIGHETSELMQILAPSFVLNGVGTVAQATLLRRLEFRVLSIINISASLLNIGVALVLALSGYEATALILGRLAGMVASIGAITLRARLPMPRWRPGVFADLRSFGIPAAGAGLVYTAFRNIDVLLIGARLGAAQVGYFWRAFNLAFEYQGKITQILQQVALPVLSRAESLDDMRTLRFRMVRIHASLLFPLLLLLIAVAPVAVPWLYGSQWEDAVLPTQILAVAGLTVAIGAGVGPLLLAAGRPRLLLVANAAGLALYAPAVYFTAPLGLVEVCCATVAAYMLKTLGVQYFILDRRLGIPLGQLLHDAGPALVSGLGGFAVSWFVVEAGRDWDVPSLAILAGASAIFAVVYLTAMRKLFGEAWADLMLLARALAGGRRLPFRRSRRADREAMDRV